MPERQVLEDEILAGAESESERLRDGGDDLEHRTQSPRDPAGGQRFPGWTEFWRTTGQDVEKSLSDYYHSKTGWHRDFFIGVLCAIAVFLVLYRGLQRQTKDKVFWNESTLLNVAGGAALGVAFFPVSAKGAALLSPHTLFALALFLCLIIVGVVLPPKTDDLSTKRVRAPYFLWSAGMVLGVVTARWSVLVAEILLIGSFAGFWYFRTRELTGKTAMPAMPWSKGRGGSASIDR